MKILIINGSPRKDSNSEHLIKEITNTFNALNAQYEVISIVKKTSVAVLLVDIVKAMMDVFLKIK